MGRCRTAFLLAIVLATGGLTSLTHAAAPAPDGQVTVVYDVPTRHGTLFLEVVHPTSGGEILRAPAVLTYSPYSVLGRNGDVSRWVPRGYARMYADVVGTGNSGGCYDYGGRREKQTGYDLVEWVAAQPWSTGRVGMIGGSYDGTTATATATQRPPHLTTIVPQAAISRWYGYAYSGGIRYTDTNEQFGPQGPTAVSDEGLDTPLAFDFGFAIPPPTDVTSPRWQEKTLSAIVPCEEFQHTRKGYELTPDYDAFWLDRDYLRDAAKITIPVLIGFNWGDWNVKQEESINLWRALTRSKVVRLYGGTRWAGHGTPTGEYKATVDAWMDRWLMGERNNIERTLPAVVSQAATSSANGEFLNGRPKVTAVRLSTGPQTLELTQQPAGSAMLPMTMVGSESRAASDPQREATWLYFETPPLARSVRLFGSPVVDVALSAPGSWVTLTPSLLDIDPEARSSGTATDPSHVVAFTRGWLDTRYRNTLARQDPVPAGTRFRAKVVAKPQDYIVQAGHRIGLILQTDNIEWAIAKAAPCDVPPCGIATVFLGAGGTTLTLPVVDAPRDLRKLFS